MPRHDWTENELLLAFGLYSQLPFGQLHQNNPEIMRLSGLIGRTPSAVAMKACNFASLDPIHKQRGVRALGNASSADKALWERYETDPDALIADVVRAWDTTFTEEACAEAELSMEDEELEALDLPSGPSTYSARVQVRRLQRFFRQIVLSAYGYQCALSDVELTDLLNASHIIPWAEAEKHRLDPRNGIALNALYDRAFDRGFFTLDEDYRVVVARDLPDKLPLFQIQGKQLTLPDRFAPKEQFLEYHRQSIFRS